MDIAKLISYDWFPVIIKSVFILLGTIILVKIAEAVFNREKLRNLIHIKFFKNICIALIWVFGATLIICQFKSFSRVVNTVLAGSGILAMILGLAAQESFANILSGIFISMFKPFNIGDRIRIVGDETAGFVEDITLRHTIIRTYTNIRIIVPNSIMGNSKIENSTYSVGASYPIDVTIAYEDIEKRHRALEIMQEVVINHPLFYDHRTDEEKSIGVKPVEATCIGLGESGINLRILMWTENFIDNNKACSDCRMMIIDKFEEEGIEIPYNKLVIVNNN